MWDVYMVMISRKGKKVAAAGEVYLFVAFFRFLDVCPAALAVGCHINFLKQNLFFNIQEKQNGHLRPKV